MGTLARLARRIAGFFRALVGRRKARRRLNEIWRLDISPYINRIISDAVLLNEIPSPTDNEKLRADFVLHRLRDFGISNVTIDDAGNVTALFPAFGTRRDFLLMAADIGDADYSPLENSVRLTRDRATGQGLGESSLGAAALLVLAELAQETGFHLDKNLVLLFTRSLSIDESGGSMRAFLDAWGSHIACGIFVRGTGFGLVESRRLGAYRLAVDVRTQERDLLEASASASAAYVLSAIAFQIGGIKWDPTGSTIVNIARIEAGVGYGRPPAEGNMEIEILSENEQTLEAAYNAVSATIARIASGFESSTVTATVRSRHPVGDETINVPMTQALQSTLAKLRAKAEPGVVSERVALLNEYRVPGLALGIATGKKTLQEDYVELQSIETGFRQLLLVTQQCSAAFDTAGSESP